MDAEALDLGGGEVAESREDRSVDILAHRTDLESIIDRPRDQGGVLNSNRGRKGPCLNASGGRDAGAAGLRYLIAQGSVRLRGEDCLGGALDEARLTSRRGTARGRPGMTLQNLLLEGVTAIEASDDYCQAMCADYGLDES